MYFHPHNNVSCGLDTIAALSCNDQICHHVFDLNALCSNSTLVSVTVLATNAQRDAEPITTGKKLMSLLVMLFSFIRVYR